MATLYLHHDRHFDFVPDPGGDHELLTSDGMKPYRRDLVDAPGGLTRLAVPDGYDATPTALMHLVQTLVGNHAPMDEVHAVSGDEPNLVRKLAAVLEAEILEVPA